MFQLYSLENVVFLLWTKCLHQTRIDTAFKLRTKSYFIVAASFKLVVAPQRGKGVLEERDRNPSMLIWNSTKTINTAAYSIIYILNAIRTQSLVFISKNGISCQCSEQKAWLNPETPQIRLFELFRLAPELWQCMDSSCRVARDQTLGFCMDACENIDLWF